MARRDDVHWRAEMVDRTTVPPARYMWVRAARGTPAADTTQWVVFGPVSSGARVDQPRFFGADLAGCVVIVSLSELPRPTIMPQLRDA